VLGWESYDYRWVTFDELLSIEPKHPGLEMLLNDEDSLDVIKHLIK
jgi:hypothetical protein